MQILNYLENKENKVPFEEQSKKNSHLSQVVQKGSCNSALK